MIFRIVRRFGRVEGKAPARVPAVMDFEELAQRELKLHEEELYKKHSELQQAFDSQVPFFYKMYGTKDKYEEKTSFMAKRLMSYYGVHDSTLTNYLCKIFKGTLQAAVNRDSKFMEEYVEPTLAQRIKKDIQSVEKSNLTLLIDGDVGQNLDRNQNVEMIELALIKGLSVDRQKNKPISDYIKFKDDEEVGLTIYTPKHLTDPSAFIDPKTNKTIYDDFNDLLIMRVLARIKTPMKLRIKELPLNQEMYTGEHICIFENQMFQPKKWTSGYKMETYLQWLSKFKFGMWRLADIDNSMKGNSLIRQGVQKKYQAEIFKKSKFDASDHIEIKDAER